MPVYPYDRLSREVMTDLGYNCWKTEHWCPFSRRRKDLYNFIDSLAMEDDHMIGIQSSSASGRSKRHKKITDSPHALQWLKCPNRGIWLVTWAKKKVKRGGKAFKYIFTVDDYYLVDNTIHCNRDLKIDHKKCK